ncbi:MAG: hypothetical protein DRG36_02640 [Deltaproteobacteria bacterium]|nr:MAG: hypothetical protein DRG36_02640 [Deltaproteobacteria bacterium]
MNFCTLLVEAMGKEATNLTYLGIRKGSSPSLQKVRISSSVASSPSFSRMCFLKQNHALF